VGLGSLKFVDDPTVFVAFSFIWKFLTGIGAGINSTASFAIIAAHYKEDREKTIGMLQACAGLGLLLGPLFGGVLYELGGFIMPFFATGKKFCSTNTKNTDNHVS
jgi:MFS family permease